VTDLADAQCVAAERAAESGNQSVPTAVSRVKQQALGLLIDTELSLQYGKEEGIKPSRVLYDGFYKQFDPIISTLPGKTQTVLTDVFQRWSKGRATLVQAGTKATGLEWTLQNTEQLVTAGLEDRAKWLEDSDITTDPRYAPTEQGFPGGGDGSVSRAGSDFAKGAAATESDPSWVSGLPADQKCG
jgi:hypothetical protein